MEQRRGPRNHRSQLLTAAAVTAAAMTAAACQPPACAAIGYPWSVDLTVTLGDSWDRRDDLVVDVECVDSTTCLHAVQPEPTADDAVREAYLDEEPAHVLVIVTRDGEVLAEVPTEVRYLRDRTRARCHFPRAAVAVVEDPDHAVDVRPLVPGADRLED